MKKTIFIIGFILIIIGCTDKKQAKPALDEVAKDTVLADSYESSYVFNESEAIWGFVTDTVTGNEELIRLKTIRKRYVNRRKDGENHQ
jgi:hypothetical protein